MSIAMSTAKLVAASAEPERARLRERSRIAMRIPIGALRPILRTNATRDRAEKKHADGTRHEAAELVQVVAGAAPTPPARRSEQIGAQPKEDRSRQRRPVRRLRRSGPAREGRHDRDPAIALAGSSDATVAVTIARAIAEATSHQGSSVQTTRWLTLADRCGAVPDPRADPDQTTEDRGDDADDGAVGDHDQSDVAVGGTDRFEHAERTEPALSQHREPSRGDEPDEDQPEDCDDEHDDRRVDPVRHYRNFRRGAVGEMESGQRTRAGVEQDGHLAGRADLTGSEECEIVEQVLRVLDNADDVESATRLVPDAAYIEAQS